MRMWCCKRCGQRGIPAHVYSHWTGCVWFYRISKRLTGCRLLVQNLCLDVLSNKCHRFSSFAVVHCCRDDNGSAGHGSSWSTIQSGSRVSTRDPLTHDQVNTIPRTADLRHSLSHNVSLIQLFLQSILWQWWCLLLRPLPLSCPDWKLQQSGVMTRE